MAHTLEPQTQRKLEKVVVLEVRQLQPGGGRESAAVAGDAAVVLDVDAEVVKMDAIRRDELAVPVQQVERDTRDRFLAQNGRLTGGWTTAVDQRHMRCWWRDTVELSVL